MAPFFLRAFEALPRGGFTGVYAGRRYGVTLTVHAVGRSRKLVARALDGSDYISLNLYILSDGRALLRPCEMPEAKVRDFVIGLRPEAAGNPQEAGPAACAPQ